MFGRKLNAAFQISHPKIGRFLLSMPVGSKFQIFIGFFVWKVSSLKESFAQEVSFVTLKGCGMCWPKLKAAFQISPTKIGKFLSSRRRGSKFQILLLSFAWKVNWLSQKTFTGVSFCHTEGSWNVCAKTECCFPNQPSQNWSISLEDATRVQISNFIEFFVWKVSSLKESFPLEFFFCDTEGLRNVLAKTESSFPNQPTKNWKISFEQAKRVQISNFIALFCLKGKLAEPKNLHRSFFLWH